MKKKSGNHLGVSSSGGKGSKNGSKRGKAPPSSPTPPPTPEDDGSGVYYGVVNYDAGTADEVGKGTETSSSANFSTLEDMLIDSIFQSVTSPDGANTVKVNWCDFGDFQVRQH